jgi:glyoxylase I family protein
MNLTGFHHLAIQVNDVERVASFWREVLGLTELARHRLPDQTLRSIWLKLPGEGFVALEKARGEPPAEAFGTDRLGPLMIAFRIHRHDRPALIAELSAKGVDVVHQTRWTVYVRDPEGNRIAFSHHPEDPL